MNNHVYGKKGCKLCKSAKKKVEVLLDRWGVSERHEVELMDMETVHGAAEGDFFDVFEIPTVMVMRDRSSVAARWDGSPPPSEELQELLNRAHQEAEGVAA